jgi:HK97 family phage prohead protease
MRENPVVLINHDARGLPIGHSTTIGIAGGKLRATVQLASDVNPQAAQAQRMIEHGSLKGASIGFIPVSWSPRRDGSGGIRFDKTSLIEWSIVNVPAAPGALQILEGIGELSFAA